MNFRKGIIAAATAVAVATSGVATAEAAENSATPTPTATKAAQSTPNKSGTPKVGKTTTPGSSSMKDMRPSEIRDWIAVFTAVIGALGTLFAFLDKHLRK